MVQQTSHSTLTQPTYESLFTSSGALVNPSGVDYFRDGRPYLGHRIRIAAASPGATTALAGLPAATTATTLIGSSKPTA